MYCLDFMFGLILIVAQRCVPTIFDNGDVTSGTLVLTNSANVNGNLTITELQGDELQDIKGGTE